MKITVTKESHILDFCQLAVGELFIDPKNDKVYMKVSPNNVVRMDTGSMITFASSHIVMPVDGELIITRKD